MQQHTTNPTIDTLETLYWQARDSGRDALAKAIGLALDAAAEASQHDANLAGIRVYEYALACCADCETPTNHDDAPAHGIPRPRFPLAWCQWCRTIDCECM